MKKLDFTEKIREGMIDEVITMNLMYLRMALAYENVRFKNTETALTLYLKVSLISWILWKLGIWNKTKHLNKVETEINSQIPEDLHKRIRLSLYFR